MNNQRKRELKEAYRTSRPPMGVLSFRCVPTGESFLLASRNIPGDTNGVTFKLNSDYHPNRHLLELWRRYGEENFQVEVLEELDYRDESDDPADYKEELSSCAIYASSATRVPRFCGSNRLRAAERAASRKVNSGAKTNLRGSHFPYR